VALGKYFRMLLIVLDISLLAYTATQLMYRVLPVTDPFFWIGAIVEIGLAASAYIIWMRSLQENKWNSGRTVAVTLLAIGILWPIVLRYTNVAAIQTAASSDLLFYCTGLTLLIYSSFVISRRNTVKKA